MSGLLHSCDIFLEVSQPQSAEWQPLGYAAELYSRWSIQGLSWSVTNLSQSSLSVLTGTCREVDQTWFLETLENLNLITENLTSGVASQLKNWLWPTGLHTISRRLSGAVVHNWWEKRWRTNCYWLTQALSAASIGRVDDTKES